MATFQEAREFLLAHADDYDTAYRDFRWPELDEFNWALDWFDRIAAEHDRTALRIVEADGCEQRWSFAELAAPLQPGGQLAARPGRRAAATG